MKNDDAKFLSRSCVVDGWPHPMKHLNLKPVSWQLCLPRASKSGQHIYASMIMKPLSPVLPSLCLRSQISLCRHRFSGVLAASKSKSHNIWGFSQEFHVNLIGMHSMRLGLDKPLMPTSSFCHARLTATPHDIPVVIMKNWARDF